MVLVCFSTCNTTGVTPSDIADTPEQPINVRVTDFTAFSVALAWVEPHDNNAPISDYIIYIDSVGTDPTEVRANASVEAFNVTGLRPFVNYSLTVAAENDEGIGLRSTPVVQQTSEFCEWMEGREGEGDRERGEVKGKRRKVKGEGREVKGEEER